MTSVTTSSAPSARKQPYSPMRRREAIEGWLYLSPWVIGFIVFVAGPLVASLYFSFTKYNVLRPPQYIGLKNYVDAFINDPLFLPSIVRSFYYAALSVPLGLIGSLFAGNSAQPEIASNHDVAHLLFSAHADPADCSLSFVALDVES